MFFLHVYSLALKRPPTFYSSLRFCSEGKDGCILQKHSLAFYVFLDQDFPALLVINSMVFGSAEKQYTKLHFRSQIPKAISHSKGYTLAPVLDFRSERTSTLISPLVTS